MKTKLPTQKMRFFLILVLVFCSFAQSNAQWKTVRIGGGGNVTSIQAHPKVQNLYFITTDVGTPYRWNSTNQAWEGLFYSLSDSYWAKCASGNIAFAPGDNTGNILYATIGGPWVTGSILKSTDRGTHWTDCKLPLDVKPNNDQGYGQRLAIDPNNSNVIYVTTRPTTTGATSTINGTFRSTDAGKTWTKINDLCGSFLIFDTSAGVANNVTNNIFIGCREGVYLSTNGGADFTLMPGSPTNCLRSAIHSNGTLYITHYKSVSKWNGSEWKLITPSLTYQYQAIDVNPQNSDQLVVGVTSFSPYRFDQFVSNDGGTTWKQIYPTADSSEVPWFYGSISQGLGDFCWDPFDQNMVWFTDFFNAHQTTNIWAGTNVTWKARAVGEEETVAIGNLLCPPSGENVLHSCVADVGGWDHKSLTTAPSIGMMKLFPWTPSGDAGNMTGVAIQETDPNFIARVGRHSWDKAGYAGHSTDGGATYTIWVCPSDAAGGRIAVSATSHTMVWITQSGPSYRSTDSGKTWTVISTLPANIITQANVFACGPVFPIAADKVNGNKFYVYTGGKVFISTDGGATFSQGASLPNPYISNPQCIETTPGKEGDIWVAANTGGLFHSTNSGASFSTIANVQQANVVSIGKASPSNPNVPAIYVYGTVNNISNSLFRSNDNGATWQILSSPVHTGIEPYSMAADRQVYGRVFFSTTGNGIMYLEEYTDTQAPNPPTDLASTGITNALVRLTWIAASDNVAISGYNIYKDGVQIGTSTTCTYTVSNLSAGATYAISVRAKDLAGNLSEPISINVTTLKEYVAPENIALNKTATASSMYSSTPAQSAVDGKTTTRWAASNGNRNEWLKVDLGAKYNITGAEIYWENTPWIYKYRIHVSNDDTNWTLALDKSSNTYYGPPSEIANFTANGYRYIRITITDWGNGGWWSSIYEFNVYGTILTGENELKRADLRIYPNPASEFINIDNLNAKTDIKVFNIDGKIIYSVISNSSNLSIPVNNFNKGLYILRIKDEGGLCVKKVIVE